MERKHLTALASARRTRFFTAITILMVTAVLVSDYRGLESKASGERSKHLPGSGENSLTRPSLLTSASAPFFQKDIPIIIKGGSIEIKFEHDASSNSFREVEPGIFIGENRKLDLNKRIKITSNSDTVVRCFTIPSLNSTIKLETKKHDDTVAVYIKGEPTMVWVQFPRSEYPLITDPMEGRHRNPINKLPRARAVWIRNDDTNANFTPLADCPDSKCTVTINTCTASSTCQNPDPCVEQGTLVREKRSPAGGRRPRRGGRPRY